MSNYSILPKGLAAAFAAGLALTFSGAAFAQTGGGAMSTDAMSTNAMSGGAHSTGAMASGSMATKPASPKPRHKMAMAKKPAAPMAPKTSDKAMGGASTGAMSSTDAMSH